MSVHKPKICLACSAGGHLRELQLAIGDIPNNWNCYWLTLKTTSTKAFMKDKEHVFLVNFQPAKKWSLIINCIQAIFWVLIKRPNVIITTGAGVAVSVTIANVSSFSVLLASLLQAAKPTAINANANNFFICLFFKFTDI